MFHTSSFIYVSAIFLNQSFFSARDKNRNLSINRFQLIGLITLFIFILMVIFLEFKSVNVCSFYPSEPNHQLMRITKEAKLGSKTYVFLLTKIRMQIGTRDKRVCYMSKPLKTKVL
jgi:flagellar biogenesis protein FliO